jgi:hypothetical protein
LAEKELWDISRVPWLSLSKGIRMVCSRRQPVSSNRRFRKKSPAFDYGAPERWQHSGRILLHTEKAGVLAGRAIEEHIIDIMVTRGLLTSLQSEAAFIFKLAC